MKPYLFLQPGIFSEDSLQNSEEIISRHFDIEHVTEIHRMMNLDENIRHYRGSLHMARVLGEKFEFANALKFMPRFRGLLIDYTTEFSDLTHIKDFFWKDSTRTKFIRPVSPFKEFAGNVFTEQKFIEEYNFLIQNKNMDPYLICAIGDVKPLGREWRCIFIDNKYVAGSQYLNQAELEIKPEIPEKVVEFAENVAKDDYFLNVGNFVLDFCECCDRLALVEINAFETSSFYGADLDKIYSAWAAFINSN